MSIKLKNFILTILLTFIFSQFLPWWSIMIAAFITSLILSLEKRAVFFIPFLAVTVFWIVYAFWLSSANDFTLAKKIAVLLPLGGNPYILILLTGIIGGIAAGITGVFGKQVALIFNGKK